MVNWSDVVPETLSRTLFLAYVARLPDRLLKLVTGRQSSVLLRWTLDRACGGRRAGPSHRFSLRLGLVLIVDGKGIQSLAYVPLRALGKHADGDMRIPFKNLH